MPPPSTHQPMEGSHWPWLIGKSRGTRRIPRTRPPITATTFALLVFVAMPSGVASVRVIGAKENNCLQLAVRPGVPRTRRTSASARPTERTNEQASERARGQTTRQLSHWPLVGLVFESTHVRNAFFRMINRIVATEDEFDVIWNLNGMERRTHQHSLEETCCQFGCRGRSHARPPSRRRPWTRRWPRRR